MSHKTIAKIAVFMIVVFGAMILVYPLLFNPDSKGKATLAAPPPIPTIPAPH
jgi:hypothetical protein